MSNAESTKKDIQRKLALGILLILICAASAAEYVFYFRPDLLKIRDEQEVLKSAFTKSSPAGVSREQSPSAAAGEPGSPLPNLRLDRIVPYGRSFELVGFVEPGAALTVNDDPVDVPPDGNFKHFTKPFHPSMSGVVLVLRAVDLTGRESVLTARATLRANSGD